MDGRVMGNVYEVEHLATFQLSEELNAPSDGMRRLLHMQTNGLGIWSQKIRVHLEQNFIVILDFQNGDEMERFPLHMIRQPTAFTNPNPDLVEDVNLAMAGQVPPSRSRYTSSPSSPPPPPLTPPHFKPSDSRNDTFSNDTEGQYERQIAILNSCFDDIEHFIALLQYVATAYRELQRRRMSKKSNKDHGEGLLSMQATRPHELEFVHILQKFKLCFNLLACLKAHIQDPNSPEMVHFLFTPLAMIVNASRETHPPGLAARVVAPLLSREAVDLLTNCLNSKETQLWHSLGDAWHLTREQWKGYVAPYQPVFMEGWSPTIPDRSSSSAIGVAVAEAATRRLQAQQETEKLESPFLRKLPHFHCTSVSISLSQIEPYTCSSSKSKYEIQLRLQLLQRCANIHSQTIPTMGDILMARDDDMMQQELRTVLTLFREKRKIEIQKNAEVYINQHSSVEEVQEWLKVKGFSDPISKQLSNMNGTELFSLKKEQLEAYCGKAEGRRLGSQINISRSTTGFKTARSSELRTILAKALAKVESGTSPSPNPSTRH